MRKRTIGLTIALAVLSAISIGGAATAGEDESLVGTWHQRDLGHSNIFYFVGEAVGGVYPVLFLDDATGEAVCGDNGPMLWSGFVHETESDIDTVTFEGSFGNYWCPDNGDGSMERPFEPIASTIPITLVYDVEHGTISGGIGTCVGSRVENLDNPNEALEEIAEGEYPPPVWPPPGC